MRQASQAQGRLASATRHLSAPSTEAAVGAQALWPGLAAIAPNTKAVFRHLVVGGGADEADLAMPVYCVRGAHPGPTLLTIAGVHGDEFEPMAATQDLFAALDPSEMSGTLLSVGCAGVSGYQAADRFSPLDGKNIARCYPGRATGSYTERVAFTLQTDFIELPEVAAVVDLHSAGKTKTLVTMVGYLLYRDPADAELGAASQALARAMALDLVWGHYSDPEACKAAGLNVETNGRTTMYGGYLAGKPTTYCETTGTGGCRRRDVTDYVAGLHRALAHLGILSAGGTGAIAPTTPRLDTIDTPPPSWSGGETDQAFSGHMQSQNCTPTAGLWRAKVDLWETVKEGQLIGTVSDLFGNLLFEKHAAKSGTVILLQHLARVEAGDSLLIIV